MYAGGLALLLALPLTAAAQDTVSQTEHLTTVRNLKDTRERLYAAQAALSDAHLQQMALLVRLATQGKDRLLLGSGVSANPKLGKIPIREGQGNAPFITFYPVTKPVSVPLADVGVCEILGVVRLSVGAYRSEKNTCEPGSYLLTRRTDANGTTFLSLLEAQADADGQIHYQEALQILTERVQGTVEKFMMAFPGRDEVSAQHPAWEVRFDLPGKEQHVRAFLRMEIEML